MEELALRMEYEELIRYCPMLITDVETAQGLDRHTLQVLSATARNYSMQRKELQRQGIEQARIQGVQFGRPKAQLPGNFEEIVGAWKAKKISREEAIRQSGVSVATFYRYVRKLREQV